jgi:CMP-N-acetylneuraminic acid synthetase
MANGLVATHPSPENVERLSIHSALDDGREYNNGRAIGIIPARGGSKSVPRKNLKLLGSLPLIAYSIISARAARQLDGVIVSTDDAEIATAAREYGADVPFLRPKEIAADDTPDLPVLQHALRWLAEHQEYHPEFVIHLRPTQPFRPPELIDTVVKLLREKAVDCVKSLVPVDQHPHKMWRLDAAGTPAPLLDTPLWREIGPDCPRQYLEPVYWSAGLVDGIRSETILGGSTIGSRIEPLFVDPALCAELDTPHHFVIAEAMLEHLRGAGVITT